MIKREEFIKNLLKRLEQTMLKELPEETTLEEMYEQFFKTLKGKFFLKGGN